MTRSTSCFRKHAKSILTFCVVLAVLPVVTCGRPDSSHAKLKRADKTVIIDWVCENVDSNYIHPDIAVKMIERLHEQNNEGKYEDIDDVEQFARALTKDLRTASKDLHVSVRMNFDPPPPETASTEEKQKWEQAVVERGRQENFHFKKVENLSGNVGYLRFDQFDDPRYAGDTAVAAMNFLANCDALIIDLRHNGGGHSTMEQLLLSYFFDEPIHFSSYEKRDKEVIEQDWTMAHVPGPKLLDADLYVLTSTDYTFSAAEGFAGALKNFDRATIIGETTSGGGHCIDFYYLRDWNLELRVSIGRAYNPTTGQDVEVTGVEPDIKVSSDKAFDTAYALALEKLCEKSDGERKRQLKWKSEYHQALANPAAVDNEVLKSYAGEYAPARVRYEKGELLVLEPGTNEYKRMFALSETVFVVDGRENIRCEFEKDKNGEVVALYGIMADGSKRRVPRTQDEPAESKQEQSEADVPLAIPEEVNDAIFDELGIEFVRVDAGSFEMGDNFGDGGRPELPVHTVVLDSFYLGATEVTFAQYDRFCNDTGREKPDDNGWGRGERPAINIQWSDAVAFCRWLTQKSGRRIRLPTEAEWEYAAREGGKKVRFGNGKDIADPEGINYNGATDDLPPYAMAGVNRGQTVPVASFAPNALGLYDMSGNVWEWCSDWFDKEYYRHSPEKNPGGPDAGTYRVMRGGSWKHGGGRCSGRGAYTPEYKNGGELMGFRLARTP